jgi:transketolase
VTLGISESLREAFGDELCRLAAANPRIVVLDGDLANSTFADRVADCRPDQFLEMGIAEQNMVGVAAGLAAVGLRPWVSSFATFLSKRALDQVKVVVAQTNLPVVLVGAYSGLLNGRNGKTHQALFDLGIMRSLPGMAVVSPCDAVELRGAMRWLADHEGPAYLRLPRDPAPVVTGDAAGFHPGVPAVLRKDDEPLVAMVSTGVQSGRVLDAARILGAAGIPSVVVHLPTLVPLEEHLLAEAVAPARVVVTVEDGLWSGGLGGLVCEVLSEHRPMRVIRIGLRDYAQSASNADLLAHYGLDGPSIAERVTSVVAGRLDGRATAEFA